MNGSPSRVLLWPFSVLYGAGSALRNLMFDAGWLRSFAFDFPVIVVGNLQAGGTGKTPCVEYLVRKLSERYAVAVLSRGYGRNTRGYLLAGPEATADDIGDEPLLLKRLHPSLELAVGEQRVPAIPALLTDAPQVEVIVCDDAFQHRPLRGGFNLLLTGYDKLYIDDAMLPAGRLRESVSGARRAQAIVVTGCPSDLSEVIRQDVTRRLRVRGDQPVYFAGSVYGQPYKLGHPANFSEGDVAGLDASSVPGALKVPVEGVAQGGRPDQPLRLVLLTGIARSGRVKQALESGAVAADTGALPPIVSVTHLSYPDHHIWQSRDLERLRRVYAREAAAGPCIILTTEKDAVRLDAHASALADLPVYVLPVRMQIPFGAEAAFDAMLLRYVEGALARQDKVSAG
ncbi:MAG: tetraacyldisaccharide 4'-kinase [Bacteroidetes bacterium]|nr:tetraacyldisaccharide 4'-kinase [Bacteroidota bacterium]